MNSLILGSLIGTIFSYLLGVLEYVNLNILIIYFSFILVFYTIKILKLIKSKSNKKEDKVIQENNNKIINKSKDFRKFNYDLSNYLNKLG